MKFTFTMKFTELLWFKMLTGQIKKYVRFFDSILQIFGYSYIMKHQHTLDYVCRTITIDKLN